MWRVRGVIRTVRPNQWVKNLFVVAPLFFAREVFDTSRVQLTTSRPAGSMLVDAMTPGVTLTVKAGGLLDVEVPAQGSLVLVKP